eukprot:977891-Prymnesium_polylepis.1
MFVTCVATKYEGAVTDRLLPCHASMATVSAAAALSTSGADVSRALGIREAATGPGTTPGARIRWTRPPSK